MKTIIVVIFALTFFEDAVLGIDYCQAGLCQPNEKHIGCGATGNFGTSCPSERALIAMTVDLQAYLLKKHNLARSQVANGNLTGYLNANQMVEMTWDAELAKLAQYNALTCIYGHDQCRNTATYKYAGQNIAMVMSTPNYFETYKAVDYLFDSWFGEYKDCSMTYINKYGPTTTGKAIGHFTQSKVGCAIITFANSSKNLYLVCDYSLTNISDRPIYKTGKPCSACTTGCSKTYSGLCSSAEVIPFP